MDMQQPRHQKLTRYIVPLREGGSLPALAEADDGFKYVVKFRGAGHGTKALVAELLGGEIARRLGLNVPELVWLDVDSRFGSTEPDEEIQDLLKASRGLNIGLHFLEGAITLDPYANDVDPLTASKIVWLDAFITNVDRTVKNTNLLRWHSTETWLIDHGASFYYHHSWTPWEKAALTPFAYIRDHALLHKASRLDEADMLGRQMLGGDFLTTLTGLLPDDLLTGDNFPDSPDDTRKTYAAFLEKRLENSEIFLTESKNARRKLI